MSCRSASCTDPAARPRTRAGTSWTQTGRAEAERPPARLAGVSPRTGLGRDGESACRVYRPRDPRKTALWRLLDTLYERVKGAWEERFERKYGYWRGVRCRKCPQEFLVAFSCKGRGLCPSCGAKRAAELVAFLADEVVENVGHAQWVFTVPKVLRVYFLYHREPGELSRAAAETARELLAAAAGEEEGFRAGIVSVVQTFGDRANFHPHVHALVKGAGVASGPGATERGADRSAPVARRTSGTAISTSARSPFAGRTDRVSSSLSGAPPACFPRPKTETSSGTPPRPSNESVQQREPAAPASRARGSRLSCGPGSSLTHPRGPGWAHHTPSGNSRSPQARLPSHNAHSSVEPLSV